MDIKNVVRAIIPVATPQTSEVNNRVKTDATADREGNGQAGEEKSDKRRHLSPEEILQAIKYLEELPGIKENKLSVRLESHDGISVVWITDSMGEVVRRIPESELSLLASSPERKSGHLLNKAM